jgi:protein farnesyltransferase/geranylgeranyltransferase type-1 subunit alpha
VWFHRRWLVEQIVSQGVIDEGEMHAAELERVSELIDQEPKHYNAWSHKIFLAELFNTYHSNVELDFSEKYINLDVRNNSAWSYRRHCISRLKHFPIPSELAFVIHHITKAPSNESPWVFLRSLPDWYRCEEVEVLCDQILSTSDSYASRHVIDTLALLYEKTGRPQAAIDLRSKLSASDLNRQAYLQYRNRLVVV